MEGLGLQIISKVLGNGKWSEKHKPFFLRRNT